MTVIRLCFYTAVLLALIMSLVLPTPFLLFTLVLSIYGSVAFEVQLHQMRDD